MNTIELIGYAGSVLVAISLMMSAIIKLRIINLIGALFFTIYGILIGAIPVALLNGFIVIANSYYLIQFLTEKEYFRILEFKGSSEYLKYFIDFYKQDIMKFNPSFNFPQENNWESFFILRNTTPAGLFCLERLDEESVIIKLDYAIPSYRDFKMGEYVFKKIFRQSLIKKMYSAPGNETHNKYLQRMGFREVNRGGETLYLLERRSGGSL